jgi:hypothetical protein
VDAFSHNPISNVEFHEMFFYRNPNCQTFARNGHTNMDRKEELEEYRNA